MGKCNKRMVSLDELNDGEIAFLKENYNVSDIDTLSVSV